MLQQQHLFVHMGRRWTQNVPIITNKQRNRRRRKIVRRRHSSSITNKKVVDSLLVTETEQCH